MSKVTPSKATVSNDVMPNNNGNTIPDNDNDEMIQHNFIENIIIDVRYAFSRFIASPITT